MTDKIDKELLSEIGAVQYAVHKIHDQNTIKEGIKTDMNVMDLCSPKPGSYKYIRPDTKEEVIVPPGHPMYSSAGMFATHYFNGEQWVEFDI